MQALYKNVLRGKYPPIPTHFSIDMRKLIAAMLDLDPAKRPTTVSIMTTEYVIKRIQKYFKQKDPLYSIIFG